MRVHNPNSVSADKLPPGHRFLDQDEVRYTEDLRLEGPGVSVEQIRAWLTDWSEWSLYPPVHDGYAGSDLNITYCTFLSREALAQRRGIGEPLPSMVWSVSPVDDTPYPQFTRIL